MSRGIDYGLGLTNVDRKTGIRYGVISSHVVGERWFEASEADYGEPICPKCGREAYDSAEADSDDENGAGALSDDWFEGKDFYCLSCKLCFWSDEAYGDEAIGFDYEDEEYRLTSCLDSDIMVLKSPYYTRAQFCSPCVPGAGNLESPTDEGEKTYALGHDWFEDGKAPYRLFRVDDDTEVFPTEE